MNDDFDSVAGLSQIMQAEAIRFAVEAHRRNMPYCMGTLYGSLMIVGPLSHGRVLIMEVTGKPCIMQPESF